jgi:hypothetical protein
MNKITSYYILLIWCSVFSSLLFVAACEETETPDNPYSNVNYNANSNSGLPEPDPASIQGLHKNIFSKKCALSGCHDGTFEPDFRTVQSSFASLVYHPVIKNTVNEIDTFALRVIPFDHQHSFIYERITTSTTEYMPSNGVRLPQSDINNIKAWIDNGAKDENGNVPVKPNLQPNILFYFAVDSTFTIRLDTVTNRIDSLITNPFIVNANSLFYIGYIPSDTLDGTDATSVSNLTNCRIKFSLDMNDFSSAVINTSFLVSGNNAAWANAVNSSLWPAGTIVYFRVYVNDGHHTADAEFPRNESPDYYKTYYSFYVQ